MLFLKTEKLCRMWSVKNEIYRRVQNRDVLYHPLNDKTVYWYKTISTVCMQWWFMINVSNDALFAWCFISASCHYYFDQRCHVQTNKFCEGIPTVALVSISKRNWRSLNLSRRIQIFVVHYTESFSYNIYNLYGYK